MIRFSLDFYCIQLPFFALPRKGNQDETVSYNVNIPQKKREKKNRDRDRFRVVRFEKLLTKIWPISDNIFRQHTTVRAMHANLSVMYTYTIKDQNS